MEIADKLSEESARAYMAEYSKEVAAELMEEYLLDPSSSICAKPEWVEAAWALVAYVRYGDESRCSCGDRVVTKDIG